MRSAIKNRWSNNFFNLEKQGNVSTCLKVMSLGNGITKLPSMASTLSFLARGYWLRARLDLPTKNFHCSPDKNCRLCLCTKETTLHILNSCSQILPEYTKLHDSVKTLLVDIPFDQVILEKVYELKVRNIWISVKFYPSLSELLVPGKLIMKISVRYLRFLR